MRIYCLLLYKLVLRLNVKIKCLFIAIIDYCYKQLLKGEASEGVADAKKASTIQYGYR